MHSTGREAGVIGYDLLNEPWCGDAFSDGSLLLPGQSGRRLLSPLYNRLHSAIRREEKEGLVLWEGVTWAHWLPIEGHLLSSLLAYLLKKLPLLSWLRILSWLGLVHLETQGKDPPEKPLSNQAWVNLPEEREQNQSATERGGLTKDANWVPEEEAVHEGWIPAFGTGFTKVPGGEEWKQKSVLSWHYYYPPLTYSTTSFPWWHRALAHWLFGPGVFLGSEKESRKLGAGSLLTEWGIARPDADKPDSWGSIEAAWVMDRADKHTLSWCYWDTEALGVLWNSEGKPIDSAVRYLSRPFPLAVAGTHLAFNFDPGRSSFHASWQIEDMEVEDVAVSLFFLPEHVFGTRVEVSLSKGLDWRRSNESRQVMEVVATSPVLESGKAWLEVKAMG